MAGKTLKEYHPLFEGKDAEGVVKTALEIFGKKLALVSSFGAESAILLHIVSKLDPATPVIFLNTGKLFGETLRFRDRLQERLGLGDIRSIAPLPQHITEQDGKGDLWKKNPDQCCHIRKTLPLQRALEEFDAILTGRKKFQTKARSKMEIIEQDENGRFRINPLANWSLEELGNYIDKHNLPRHPLVKDNYLSIGCMPCTDKVKKGESYRQGRWKGKDKQECGMHGEGI
ncbi:MAG: phosphoadenylyl-sulfate reductase [Parvibaculales bacterium]